jgi:hypothetical protein
MKRSATYLLLPLLSACSNGLVGYAAGSDAARPGPSGPDGSAVASDAPPTPPRPVEVWPCSRATYTGAWEHITPESVNLAADFQTPSGDNFGVHSVVVDAANAGTVYIGTSGQGVYKSRDCGSTWAHISTGTNGEMVDRGRNWTFVVDDETVYTNSGYGVGSVWKSLNGGVDWEEMIPDQYRQALVQGGFVQLVVKDPTDPRHLIVSPHFTCNPNTVDGLPRSSSCLLETRDAGTTWRIVEGVQGNGEGSGVWIHDSNTWFWAANANGLWRTGDAGASWQFVHEGYAKDGEALLRDGRMYVGGVFSLLVSEDNGLTWADAPGAPGTDELVTDGSTLFVAKHVEFSMASASDMSTWTRLPSVPIDGSSYQTEGLAYDAEHRILYSYHNRGGVWRLVLE